MIYNSILETIGNTPIIKVNNVGPENQNIYVKCESFNPPGERYLSTPLFEGISEESDEEWLSQQKK